MYNHVKRNKTTKKKKDCEHHRKRQQYKTDGEEASSLASPSPEIAGTETESELHMQLQKEIF